MYDRAELQINSSEMQVQSVKRRFHCFIVTLHFLFAWLYNRSDVVVLFWLFRWFFSPFRCIVSLAVSMVFLAVSVFRFNSFVLFLWVSVHFSYCKLWFEPRGETARKVSGIFGKLSVGKSLKNSVCISNKLSRSK